MIINTTYKNRENDILINELVGKKFSLIEIIKLRGIGSKRMMVEEVSLDFKHILNTIADINYCNLELRPWGVLAMINKGLNNYTWIIPYFSLSDFKMSHGRIQAEGKFIKFTKNKNYKENKSFFKKMIEHKIKFDRDNEINHKFKSYTP